MATQLMHAHLPIEEDSPTSNYNLKKTTMATTIKKMIATTSMGTLGKTRTTETMPGTTGTAPAVGTRPSTMDKPPLWVTAHGVEVRSNNEERDGHQVTTMNPHLPPPLWAAAHGVDRGANRWGHQGMRDRADNGNDDMDTKMMDDRKWEQWRGQVGWTICLVYCGSHNNYVLCLQQV